MFNALRMTSVAVTFAAGFAIVGAFGGCSGPSCDPKLCLQDNVCITGWDNYDAAIAASPTASDTKCRLPCSAPQDCPFNYHCMTGGKDSTGAPGSYCVKDRASIFTGVDYQPKTNNSPAGSAPWGVPCDPTKGLNNNADCDLNQQFWCYGVSPTDANAYCTQEYCNDDGDCPGGWWCGTINTTPNVQTAKRGTSGGTTDWGVNGVAGVCMPRAYNLKPGTYCAPCKSDVDCPLNENIKQHCVSADNNGGAELICAAECASDKNCPLDYTCVDAGVGTNVCVPRATTCMGSDNFCDPCHSDKDCAGSDPNNPGYCILADYSTEHYCTVKSPVACSVNSSNQLTAQCPSTHPPTAAGVSCSYNVTDFSFPKDQCFGLVNFGTGTNASQVGGCWTKH